jgi:UDP-N-acetylglucosamine--N-acetylmuramyl-(pentapeptide) pyrophosphoryl-undecaprenol N-acetylglucosamine transferase
MGRFFPEEKVVFTGNPVRKDIIELDENQDTALAHFGLSKDKKTILVIGGSQGALSINKGVAKGLDKLKNHGLQLIWQTGKSFLPKAKAAAEEAGYTDTYISDFVYEMDKAYAAADLVISRAGALSVSELCLTGKPAILVPFPAAAEDHQTKNALSLVNKEAALMVKDSEVNNELVDLCLELAENPQLQKTLKQNIKAFAKPNAAQDIVKEVRNIIGK